MNILAVDTSSSESSIAFFRDDLCVSERQSTAANSHNEELSLLVNQVLNDSDAKTGEIDCLVLGQGPGSFTGLRIGCSFCKGFAFSRRIPLVGISSLQAYAAEFNSQAALLVSLSDARRAEYFCSIYKSSSENGLQPIMQDRICAAAELVNEMRGEQEKHSLENKDVLIASLVPDLPFSEGLRVEKPRHIARSLGEIFVRENKGELLFGIDSLADFKLHYVRAAAAKTIAERQAESAT